MLRPNPLITIEETVKVIASSLRKGNIVEIDGKLGVIMAIENIHPGKGTPVTQMDVRRIADGVKVSLRYKTTDQVERAFVEDRKHQYHVPGQRRLPFHEHGKLRPGRGAGRHHRRSGGLSAARDGSHDQPARRHPVAIELPPKATLEVVETEPTIKSQTAASSYKPARAVERGADHGAAFRHHRHQDRGDDRRRQLRRAGQGLIAAPLRRVSFLNICSLPSGDRTR